MWRNFEVSSVKTGVKLTNFPHFFGKKSIFRIENLSEWIQKLRQHSRDPDDSADTKIKAEKQSEATLLGIKV